MNESTSSAYKKSPLLQQFAENRQAIIDESKRKGVFDTLRPRLKEVLELRYGNEEKTKTLEEVGKEFGVTRERIRQIEKKALRILLNRLKKFPDFTEYSLRVIQTELSKPKHKIRTGNRLPATYIAKRLGKAWSVGEEKRLVQEFNEHVDLSIIAKRHQRNRNGIHARLVKLGIIKSGAS